jgi:hypothetical protein
MAHDNRVDLFQQFLAKQRDVVLQHAQFKLKLHIEGGLAEELAHQRIIIGHRSMPGGPFELLSLSSASSSSLKNFGLTVGC